LSHFASKSVRGSDLQRWAGKKTQKVTRGSHRNEVSPLTQGLRYRAACDLYAVNSSFVFRLSFLSWSLCDWHWLITFLCVYL